MDADTALWSLVITCIISSTFQSGDVVFSAPSRLHAGSTLALHCRSNQDRTIHAYHFTIRRLGEAPVPLVRITMGRSGKETQWEDDLAQARGTVNAELGFSNVSFARVQISRADCTDDAEYTCRITTDRRGDAPQTSRHVTIIRNPNGVFPITATSVERNEMTNDNLGIISSALRSSGSSGYSALPVGSIAVFNCTSRESYPPATIRWCLKRPIDETFRNFAFASVQRLEMVNASLSKQSCFFKKTSLLPFAITTADNGTILSCSTDTTECTLTTRRNNAATFLITTADTDNSGSGSESDLGQVIAADSQTSTTGIMALVTAGIVLIIIGVSGVALAVFTYTKAKRIKTGSGTRP
ncbi:uncharacterized protein LOC125681463 isoform X2 [Ostrea edulis]|uniref:uncharacterized protein LOC125681463 isoform X2 n=1 Tax=Ostrea edulis TaxID=37623 RepID=UPI0024AF54BF|nr:uncharacterized protein LOC125681463 isoform X2 [Ostrea edulis]